MSLRDGSLYLKTNIKEKKKILLSTRLIATIHQSIRDILISLNPI